MSVHTADSQFNFHLPSLSYIDAKWEEPNLRAPTTSPVRKAGLAAWLSRRIAGLVARHHNMQAARELAGMTDRELLDVGITRADLSRAFDPVFNDDLRQRGTYA